MTRLLLAALCLAFTLPLGAVAQNQVVSPNDTWVTMRPQGQGFRVLMPPDWEQNTPRGPHIKLLIRSTAVANAMHVGVANCNVGVRDDPSTRNLIQASISAQVESQPIDRAEALTMFEGALSNPRIIETRVTRFSNLPAYLMVGRGYYENPNLRLASTMIIGIIMQPGRTTFVIAWR